MSVPRINPERARTILAACGVDVDGPDFHALRVDQVNRLGEEADAYAYRKPRNANGSRSRYWYAYLQRAAARREV